jgi:ATP-dependent DNA helicase DinG
LISIDEVFANDGPFAHNRPGYEMRKGQLAMAKLIERGVLEGMHSLIEAGTGVGKSYGYLVPMLRSGKKVVISTGTVALQEQLVCKDIPAVAHALGIYPKVALLKGRSQYLCRLKLDRSSAGALFAPTQTLDQLWSWGIETATGDKSDIPFVPPTHEWESLDANADDCIGELCDRFRDCFYFAHRDEARDAHIIVVNHALFFLDMAIGGILPPYDHVVLDEAHQCERWATSALTGVISPRTVGRSMRRLHSVYHLPPELEGAVDHALAGLQHTIADAPSEKYALRWKSPDILARSTDEKLGVLQEALGHVENWVEQNGLHQFRIKVNGDEEAERRRELALRVASAMKETVERARQPGEEGIAWIERSEMGSGVHTAPFAVADFLRERLFSREESVVLASATIAEKNSFAFIKRTLGVGAAQELIAPSPFDFDRQVRLYVAPASVNPKSNDFVRRAAPLLEEVLDRTQGRAFVLFTSYMRMREMMEHVRARLPYPARMQGEIPRAALLDWFRATPNAVLFGSATFWEGIDVVGDALSCVVVDRIPFPSPSDPLVAARMAWLEEHGEDGFENYMIPAAITRLKQGFGRLIRSCTDRGSLVLLDGRAGGTRFGKTILEAMPAARRVANIDQLTDFSA